LAIFRTLVGLILIMVWRLLVQAFSFLYALSFYMRFLFICAFSLTYVLSGYFKSAF